MTLISIKIDKVDKQCPLHPNVLLGKVTELENNYAKIVTKFGIISTYISTSRLNKYTQTNVTFDYTKHITISSACQMRIFQEIFQGITKPNTVIIYLSEHFTKKSNWW